MPAGPGSLLNHAEPGVPHGAPHIVVETAAAAQARPGRGRSFLEEANRAVP